VLEIKLQTLGARAPSPALRAKREFDEAENLSVLHTLNGRGRPRSQR